MSHLLLFRRVSHSQALVMKNVLETFGLETGQRVYQWKTLIQFSLNTLSYVWGSFCLNFGVASINCFGTYLGVPVLHERAMITIYQYLLDKVRKKLEGWKLHTLFRTARVALIKSALAASPIYFMQMTTIPKTILKEIECCCRQLIWGEMDGDCKLHTIRWATL